MPTDLRQLPAYAGDTTNFRAWGSGLAAQFAAVGLAQAADTGQIDWATVAVPASGSFAGYEIWRFNDALQATKPVFVKVEYGMSSNAVHLRVRVCTATNGAGTPAGQLGDVVTLASSAKTIGTLLPSYCSGDPGRLGLCTNLDSANSVFSVQIFVERTKTADGTVTGDGIVSFLKGFYQVVPFSGAVPVNASRNMATSLVSAGVSSVGPDIAMSPTIAPLGKPYFASWCAYLHADLGELQAFDADQLGASHTYMPLGDGVSATGTVQGTVAGHSLAILWE